MTPRAVRIELVVVRGMQATIAAILLWGIWVANVSVTVNAVLGLLATMLPGIIERDYEITIGPWLTFLITLAILLHTVGMTGPYTDVWWWDHLTHTFSATIVAVVGYATIKAVDEHVEEIYLPPDFMYVFIVLATLALGVFWEILEFLGREFAAFFGQEAVLVQYGVTDTVVDLLFDAVGALIAAVFGVPRVKDLVEDIEEALERGQGRD